MLFFSHLLIRGGRNSQRLFQGRVGKSKIGPIGCLLNAFLHLGEPDGGKNLLRFQVMNKKPNKFSLGAQIPAWPELSGDTGNGDEVDWRRWLAAAQSSGGSCEGETAAASIAVSCLGGWASVGGDSRISLCVRLMQTCVCACVGGRLVSVCYFCARLHMHVLSEWEAPF